MAERVSTVWMVNARTGIDGWKGELALTEARLVFRPESSHHNRAEFRMADITSVRRARGSPIVEIHLNIPDHPSVVGFYFIEPPPMRLPDTRFRLFPRYFARRSAIGELMKGNAVKSDEVNEWVRRIERELGKSDPG
jgi:hypothetical protein